MNLISLLKQDKDCGAFLKSLNRIISKGSNKRGLLFIGINPKEGKIIVYKGFIIDSLDFLGSVISKVHYQALIDLMESLNIKPADEFSIPEIFRNKEDYIFYILNSENQERFKL